MPRGDKTGPAGEGPMTGRRRGYCAGYPYPGYMDFCGCPCPVGRGFGRGRGRGFGRGFGRFRFAEDFVEPALSKQEQKKILEAELKELELDKKEIEKAIKEFK